MELNTLERTFFDSVVRVQLDFPMNATLKVQEETIDAIVVPEINSNGQFRFKYFNATPYRPPSKDGVLTFVDNEMFGAHPSLQKAWFQNEEVIVTLKKSETFPPREISFHIRVKVLFAASGHTGGLALDRNTIVLEENALTEARFSLLNFPDFLCGQLTPSPAFFENAEELVENELPDGWSLVLKPPPSRIVLDGNEGWAVTLTKEEMETRGSVTHMGAFTFHDGRKFGTEELNEFLTGTGSFLAFVAGHFCLPTVLVGYNENRSAVWGRVYGFPSAQDKSLNWFVNDHDVPQGAYLVRLFPKFWEKWKAKKEEISQAIDLYARSVSSRQNGNVLSAIGESYAALEALASLIQGKTIVGDSATPIHDALEGQKVPRRNTTDLNHPAFAKLAQMLHSHTNEGVCLLSEVRNYGPHPLKRGTNAEIKSNIHNVTQNEPILLFYLHDLSQFYFEHLFLAYCEFGDTKAKAEFGSFRPLLADLNPD